MPFGDIYPSVDDLVEQYVHDAPRVNCIFVLRFDWSKIWKELPAEEWSAFLHDWAQHIVDVNSIFRNDEVELEQMLLVLEEEFLPYDEASLWQVANAVLEKQDDRQSALRSKHSEDVFVLLQQALREKNAQLNFIRALNDTDDLS